MDIFSILRSLKIWSNEWFLVNCVRANAMIKLSDTKKYSKIMFLNGFYTVERWKMKETIDFYCKQTIGKDYLISKGFSSYTYRWED